MLRPLPDPVPPEVGDTHELRWRLFHGGVELKVEVLTPRAAELADLMPVNQLFVQCNLKTAAGAEFEQEVYATVNAVPGGKGR